MFTNQQKWWNGEIHQEAQKVKMFTSQQQWWKYYFRRTMVKIFTNKQKSTRVKMFTKRKNRIINAMNEWKCSSRSDCKQWRRESFASVLSPVWCEELFHPPFLRLVFTFLLWCEELFNIHVPLSFYFCQHRMAFWKKTSSKEDIEWRNLIKKIFMNTPLKNYGNCTTMMSWWWRKLMMILPLHIAQCAFWVVCFPSNRTSWDIT